MKQDMSPTEIKAAIRAKGETLHGLSEKSGFSRSAISIAFKTRSPFVQQAVADFLGKAPQDIWPSRYDQNGSPIRHDPRGRRNINPPNGYNRQQKGHAA
jgi:Ner family transcriptional regulator